STGPIAAPPGPVRTLALQPGTSAVPSDGSVTRPLITGTSISVRSPARIAAAAATARNWSGTAPGIAVPLRPACTVRRAQVPTDGYRITFAAASRFTRITVASRS